MGLCLDITMTQSVIADFRPVGSFLRDGAPAHSSPWHRSEVRVLVKFSKQRPTFEVKGFSFELFNLIAFV